MVSRWENGKTSPGDRYQRLLHRTFADSLESADDSWEHDMQRRAFLTNAAVAGLAGAWLYLRWRGVRLALTVLAPAPLLFLALFLFNSDVSRLSMASDAHAAAERPRAPVVLIAFDELPLNSLLDARGKIDRLLRAVHDHYLVGVA